MRVITGLAKGRRLSAPEGLDTRPTSDMAKEAIFSMIQFEVEGAIFLDLFAGSGQMGIEALSRGAGYGVFIDSSKEAQTAVLSNLTAAKLKENSRVSQSGAVSFLKSTSDCFDIAFLDPPYHFDAWEDTLVLLSRKMSVGGIIICECERNEDLPETAGNFTLKKEYRYGKAKVTTYRQGESDL